MIGKTGRNDPCPCGSGKKYKKCCMEKDRGEVRDQNSYKEFKSSFKAFGATRGLITGVSEPEIFDSLDAVYSSLRSEGYEPILNEVFDMQDDPIDEDFIDDNPVIKAYEIDLRCKHGHAYESRTYYEYADGVFECVESEFGFDMCSICDS